MQIQWPETARHLDIYRLSELYDPCTNIDAGARYLKELLARYDGDLHLTLAAYNYGPSRIPKNATSIPTGATWYSAYIYRHLNYVLGDRRNTPQVPSLYSDIGRSVLVSFGETVSGGRVCRAHRKTARRVSNSTGSGKAWVNSTWC